MPMRVAGGRLRLRITLLAGFLLAAAVAGSWFIPGLAWRGLAAMEAPAHPITVQADSQVRTPAPPIPVPAPSGQPGPAGPASPLSPPRRPPGGALILPIRLRR